MSAPEHIERSHPLDDVGSGKARKLLLAVTTSVLVLGGAALPQFFGHDLSRKYAVETIIGVDAAGLSKADRQRAITQAGKAVRSPASLDGMVRALDLGRDEEFSVGGPSVIGIVSDIVTGNAMTVSAADAKLRERLSGIFTATPDASGNRIVISVETGDAQKSTRIARALAQTYQRELAGAALASARAQVARLERTMQEAETAVSQALAKSGDPQGGERSALQRAEDERLSLEQEIATLEASVAQLRRDVETVSATSLSDLLSQSLSSAFDYSGIDQMRQMHVDAKVLVDRLAASLGPRHPRLLAAQAALTEARSKIETALTRLSTSLKQQEATASQELADLKTRREKIATTPLSPEAKALAGLQAAAEKARKDYLDATQRLDAAAVAGPIAVKTVAPANPAAAEPIGLPMWMLSSIGAALGLGFAVMLAFAMPRRSQDDDPYALSSDDDMFDDDEDDLFAGEEIDLLQPQPILHDPVAEPSDIVGTPIVEPPVVAIVPDRVLPLDDDSDAEAYAYEEPEDVFEFEHPVAANSSTPLADRVRELLLAHRMKEEEAEAHLPPLVAAVMAGGVASQPHYQHEAEEEARKTAALRQDIMSLRERVAEFNERRAAGQR